MMTTAVSAPFFRDLLTFGLSAVMASLPLLTAAIFTSQILRRRHRTALASLVLRTALFLQAFLCLGCLLLHYSQARSPQVASQAISRFPAVSGPIAAGEGYTDTAPALSTVAAEAAARTGAVLPSFAFVLAGAFWIAGSVLILLGLIFSAFYLRWLRRGSSVLPPDHHAYQLLKSIEGGTEKAGLLRTSIHVSVPFAAGPPFSAPSVFLPTNYDQPPCPLSDETAALAVICHETAHLRRHDLLWNALGKVVLLLFWPNPLQWLLIRENEITQELACDDEALRQIDGSASLSDYARCLLTLTAQSSRVNYILRHNLAAMVAAPTSLTEERIENIMADKDSNSKAEAGKKLRVVLFSGAALLSGACLLATAQIAPAARMPQIAPQNKAENPRVVELIDARDEPAISVLRRITVGSGLEMDASPEVQKRLNNNVSAKMTNLPLENAIALILRCVPVEDLPIGFKIEGRMVRIFTAPIDKEGLPIKTVSLNYTRPTQMSLVLDDLFRGTGFKVESHGGDGNTLNALNTPVRVRATNMPLPQALERVLQASLDPLKYSIDKGVVKVSLVNPPPPMPPVITKELPTKPVSAEFKDVSVRMALSELLNQARCDYSITNEVSNTDKVTDTFQNQPLNVALPRILKMSSVPLDYFVQDGVVIIRAAKQK